MTGSEMRSRGGAGDGWAGVAFAVILASFCAKAVFFAVRIRERIFPDEATWFGVAEVFSRSVFLPEDGPETFHLGLIRHQPNLYFFLMGRLLVANVFGVRDLVFLRMANVLLGALTVWLAWRLARRLLQDALPCLLFVVCLTNTMMFTFMAGAVSYDNLAVLCAVASLLGLVAFLQEGSPCSFLAFIAALLAGTLTKVTLLPYAFILLACLLVFERRRLGGWIRGLPARLAGLLPGQKAAAVGCLLLAGMNGVLYGGNLLRYGQTVPAMDRVVSLEAALQYRLFARSHAVLAFKSGKLALLDAQRIALQIRDPGDRADAWNLLLQASQEQQAGSARMGPVRYAGEWIKLMLSRTYGVAAHLVMDKVGAALWPYAALLSLACLAVVARPARFAGPAWMTVLVAAGSYVLFVMWGFNYKNYLVSGATGLALTGRYIFPVLVPLYLVATEALWGGTPRWWQRIGGGAVALFFVAAEFPWFYRAATPDWFF